MKTVKGNLITMAKNGQFDIIVHGCNCMHAMGAGIAAEIAKRCPNAKAIDDFTSYGQMEKLGKITYSIEPRNPGVVLPYTIKPYFIVVNAYTQYNPGPDFRMGALLKALKNIKNQFGGLRLRFGFPMIGAGIGGGNWENIKKAIETHLKDEDVTIVEFDGSK